MQSYPPLVPTFPTHDWRIPHYSIEMSNTIYFRVACTKKDSVYESIKGVVNMSISVTVSASILSANFLTLEQGIQAIQAAGMDALHQPRQTYLVLQTDWFLCRTGKTKNFIIFSTFLAPGPHQSSVERKRKRERNLSAHASRREREIY